MKTTTYIFKGPWIFLCFCLLTAIGFSIDYKTRAETKNNNSSSSFSPERKTSPTVNVGERASVWLKLEPGKSLDTTFYGKDSAILALQSNLAEPTSQVSADINADGYADLISGFRNAAGGGLIALHRASRQAFEPTDKQVLADLKRGVFPAAFENDALILDVPTAPDFIFAGRFSQDSALDLVFASRRGSSIYIMSSDERGGFNAAREITLDGEITALAADSFDASKLYAGLVVALRNGKSSTVSVFDGTAELLKTTPRKVHIEGDVSSLILANSGGATQGKDIFGVADGRIFTMSRIGNLNTSINKIELPFRAVDIAVGEFIRDREGIAEIAVLSEDGNVSYLTRGSLDTRPFTTEEVLETWRQNGGRGRGSLTTKTTTKDMSDDWSVAESHQLGVYSFGGSSSARTLQKASITGNETDDLLVTDSNNNRVQILFKEPNTDKNKTSFTNETNFQAVAFGASLAAVLPMRLNVMGQQGFVVFSKGSLEPTPVMFAPNANFAVTKTADTNDGTCDGDCSLREAVRAANTAAGVDTISFNLNGMFQLTIAGADENASATGDLDVLQALTITGNGAANTIIQAGTNTTNGIDKVLSVNPLFTSSFASSFSNMTLRFGRNLSSAATDGFGGAMDWEATSTGTISMSGMTIDSSTAINGPGGGVALVNSSGGVGAATLTNVTVSNNTASALFGGGIAVGNNTGISATSLVLSGNRTTNVTGIAGGGILLGTNSNGNGTATFTGLTVTGNSATGSGGGISTTRGLTANAPIIISNNTASIFGGGISMNTAAPVNISKATMVGNSATSNGGAIELGSGSGGAGNVLNMSFSRIVGNTGGGFTGLVTRGGTANVENNWWGCNTGPSAAPCNTAGAITGGVVDFDPWLQLRLTASPITTPVVGESRSLTASFLLNSAGGAVAASNLDVLIGLPVAWSSVGGTISGQQTTIQASGTATANFTSSTAGGGKSATAQVDNGPATVNFVVGQAATTTTITSDNPDPSVRGQTITVTYTVVGQFGGTPTGSVTVSDGVNSCMGTVAAGQCNVALTTVGNRTLSATYAGDANFNGSSDTEPHIVNKADTTTFITAESADPTAQGEVFTVFYVVNVNAPGTGTPTGNVTVSDGVNSCVGTAAAGQCSLALNTGGMRTLTATYAGDTNFNGSVSAGEPHTVLAPTAAPVELTGRVLTSLGRGIANARVTITDQAGNSRLAATSAFGYFRFADVQAGGTYIISVKSKRYIFAPQIINVTENLTDLNFIAQK